MWTAILVIVGLIVVWFILIICAAIACDRSHDSSIPAKRVVRPARSDEERVKRLRSFAFDFALVFFVAPMFLLHPATMIMAWPVALVLFLAAALVSWLLPLSFVSSVVILYVLAVTAIARYEYKRDFGVEV